MRLVALVTSVAALACASSAPHAVAAAAANTALAVGMSGVSRSQGGCYAECSPGYTCNPNTGFCDKVAPVCVPGDPDPRCPPPVAVPLGTRQASQVGEPGPPPVGVSPATGRAPPEVRERPGDPTRP